LKNKTNYRLKKGKEKIDEQKKERKKERKKSTNGLRNCK
jgi:hypothetical protein